MNGIMLSNTAKRLSYIIHSPLLFFFAHPKAFAACINPGIILVAAGTGTYSSLKGIPSKTRFPAQYSIGVFKNGVVDENICSITLP